MDDWLRRLRCLKVNRDFFRGPAAAGEDAMNG